MILTDSLDISTYMNVSEQNRFTSFTARKNVVVGEKNKGMEAMFLMMNDARLKVGLQGIAMSEISYQNALEFAKERKQMRSVVKDKQDKDSKADNIIVHPDVRRMLMNVKATTEAEASSSDGGRGKCREASCKGETYYSRTN